MPIRRITKGGKPLGELDATKEDAICSPEPSELAARVFTDTYNGQEWLICECGVTYHIRKGTTPCRNRGQEPSEEGGCRFCQRYPYHKSERAGTPKGPTEIDPTLPLIRARRRRTTRPAGEKRTRSGGSGASDRALTTLGQLMFYMRAAGFTVLDAPLPDGEVWTRLLDVLADYAVEPDDPNGLTFADLTWTPTSEDTPAERLLTVRRRWNSREYLPQVWLLGFVPGPRRTSCGAIWMNGRGGRVEVRIRSDQIAATARAKGPWVALVAGAVGIDGAIRYSTAGMQAVVAADDPVPVESSHEREVAQLLQSMEIRFYKPIHPLVDGLRPDFVIYRFRLFLEVQGVEDPKYDADKAEMHRKLLAHPKFEGWRLITYDPRRKTDATSKRPLADAYTLPQLRRVLEKWWRSPRSSAHHGGAEPSAD